MKNNTMITALRLLSVIFILNTLTLSAQNIEFVQFSKSTINQPIDIANAGDDRMFVVDQSGRIVIVENDGTVRSTPFLDIKDRVPFEGSQHGLLGLAFHPDYSTNNRFYVYYIGANRVTHISEFTVTSDPNVADPASEVKLLSFDQPSSSFGDDHKGGSVKFGSDGYLYVSTGDGGKGTNGLYSQDLNSYLGKIIRMDVPGDGTMSFPEDNPYMNDANALDGIWSRGLRNPWTTSFDRETGDFYIGDVGADRWDEIDFEPVSSTGGVNYGWACFEGDEVWEDLPGGRDCPEQSATELPILMFFQTAPAVKVTITGGFVYRGSVTPYFDGYYIYAEAYSNEVFYAHQEGGEWIKESFGDHDLFITSFGEDAEGELYAVALTFPPYSATGEHLYKIKLTEPEPEVILNNGEENLGERISQVKIYPNPSSDRTFIEGIENLNYTVRDISGKAISNHRFTHEGTDRIVIDNLIQGVYILSLSDPLTGKTNSMKFVVK